MGNDSIFSKYCPIVQDYIYSSSWKELRPVQIEAAKVLFDTEDNLILSSNTASGKTEAVFFPIITDLYNSKSNSVDCLYIAPLKSLINDQFLRMDSLLLDTHIPVCHWHGDVSQTQKTKFLENPHGILQITPESLESLLMNRYSDILRIFGGLKYIVIDEIHTLMGADRGNQILCQIDRIARVIGYQPRRIGLSATIGDLKKACTWLEGNSMRNTQAPVFEKEKTGWKLACEHFFIQDNDNDKSSSAIDEGYEYMYDVSKVKKSIIFSNSREETEYVCETMRQISHLRNENDIFYIHHGNLSASIREETEDKLKNDDGKIVACATVTMELGIDIGKLDRIVQVESPTKVSSFLQRLGRSGRRDLPPEMFMIFREENPTDDTPLPMLFPWELLRGISIIQAYIEDRYIEPVYVKKMPLSLLFHQTLSILASVGSISPKELASRVLSLSPFNKVSKETYKALLVDMIKKDYIEMYDKDSLIVGLKGEKLIQSYKFYAVFKDDVEFQVKCDSKEIGTISTPHPVGERFALAGHVWEVVQLELERKLIFVKSVDGKMKISWPGDYGEIETPIMEKMYEVLNSDTEYPYLKPHAKERLQQARFLAKNIDLKNKMLIDQGGNTKCLFPWLGTRSVATLVRILKKYSTILGIKDITHNACNYINFKSEKTCDELNNDILKVLSSLAPIDTVPLVSEKEMLLSDKFDPYISQILVQKAFAYDHLRGYEIEDRFINKKRKVKEEDDNIQLDL